MKRRIAIGTGAAAVAAGGLAAAALGLTTAAPQGGTLAANDPDRVDYASSSSLASNPPRGNPLAVATGVDGALWVALGGTSANGGTIARVPSPRSCLMGSQKLVLEDPTASRLGRQGRPLDLDAGSNGRVFAVAAGSSNLLILRSGLGKDDVQRLVEHPIKSGIAVRPTGISAQGGTVWISTIEGTVFRIQTSSSGGVVSRRDYDSGGFDNETSASITRDVAFNPSDGFAYATIDGQNGVPDQIVRLDPAIDPQDPDVNQNADIHYPLTGFRVDQRPSAITVGTDGDLWITLANGATDAQGRTELLRFRPSLGTPVRNSAGLVGHVPTGFTAYKASPAGEAPTSRNTGFTDPGSAYGTMAFAGGDLYYTQGGGLGRVAAGATAAEDVALSPGFGGDLSGLAFANGQIGFATAPAAQAIGRVALDDSGPSGAALCGVSPDTATVGGPDLPITIDGEGFAAGASVTVNGAGVAETLVNSRRMTAVVPAARLAGAGTLTVAVSGIPGSRPLRVVPQAAALSAISPSQATAGGAGFTMTLAGSGFVSGATVRVGDVSRPASFTGSTSLTTQVTAGDIAEPGARSVRVVNPGGAPSSSRTLTVIDPNPPPPPPTPPAPPAPPSPSAPAATAPAPTAAAPAARLAPLSLRLSAPARAKAGRAIALTLRMSRPGPVPVLIQRRAGTRFASITARTVRATTTTLTLRLQFPGVYRIRLAARDRGVLRVSAVRTITVTR